MTGAAICELHRRLRQVELEKAEPRSEKAAGAATAVVVENADAPPATTEKSEQEPKPAGRSPGVLSRSRASTASLSPEASPERNAGAAARPSGPSFPDAVALTPTAVPVEEPLKASGRPVVAGEGQGGHEPSRAGSSLMSSSSSSSSLSLSAVEELVYGMQALGQKAFSAVRITA